MFSEKIDSINENKSLFFFEHNDTFSQNDHFYQNVSMKFEGIKDFPIIRNINKKEENMNTERENQNIGEMNDDKYDFLYKLVENNEGKVPSLFPFENILNIFKKEENKKIFKNILNIYDA